MKRRKLKSGERPMWGAFPVDAPVSKVKPTPNWVILKENPLDNEITLSGVKLAIARPNVHNTVYGKVLAIHEETSKEIGVNVGDVVVYTEFMGSRWNFLGDIVIMPEKKYILARVEIND
jgi:co-chaperonin GroES (HSP10)